MPICGPLANCKKWVEANRCAGNDSAARCFVHQDSLPAAGDPNVFEFASEDQYDSTRRNCWSIPSGPLTCLPKSTLEVPVFAITGGFNYSSCSECVDDDTPPDGGGSGGGGGGPGGGGTWRRRRRGTWRRGRRLGRGTVGRIPGLVG